MAIDCLKSSDAEHTNYVTVHGTVIILRTIGRSRPGRSTTLRLYSCTQVDPKTQKGKCSKEVKLKGSKKTKHGKIKTLTYRVSFELDQDFGIPGALDMKNGNKHEFFLRSVSLEIYEGRHIHFECNSWVYPFKMTKLKRLFFINTSYLPDKTPAALLELRKEALVTLRGNRTGERKEWEHIYDYDFYNDLGNPDKDEHVRPVLGGTPMHPYPRRIRTGRPLSITDGVTETRKRFINLDFYVPPDERFSTEKLCEFIANGAQAIVHFVIPEVGSLLKIDVTNFKSFDQMKKDLYSGTHHEFVLSSIVMEKLKSLVPSRVFKQVAKLIKEHPLKFPIPQVIAADENAWRTDEEFAREMLSGLNPTVIKRLEGFPHVEGGMKSSIAASHIQDKLDGLNIHEAINQNRMFILDHHDYLMPYLRRINAQGICIYATRTLLFLKTDGTLKPLAIELSLPGHGEEEVNRVFTPSGPGSNEVLWQLAKAHVAVNDSGHHQLISHWLYTHAIVEPFVIATKRQLSPMHPIYKLLVPHFKDTMQINMLARSILLNAGGILERTMFPGKYAMELSSMLYANWRFREQALPEDLVKRGLAVKDHNMPSGVLLLLPDYPYATDGLEIWVAIESWVNNFCSHFYVDDNAVVSDVEIQSWWYEVRHIGHGDKLYDEQCWLVLDSIKNLVQSLTTLIWIASALHAAVNFGQYGYAGFPANRPTRCRKFIPAEGTTELAQAMRDPNKFYLEMMPDKFTTTLGLALIEVLSSHASDEVYLGQRGSALWTDDGELLRLFDEFTETLRRVEKSILLRNRDPKLKNRRGPANVPYTLLFPDSSNHGNENGITGKGIPNSVSM